MLGELPILLGADLATLPGGVVEVGGRLLPDQVVAEWEKAIASQVGAFHTRQPVERGLSTETIRKGIRGPRAAVDAVIQGMASRGRLVVNGGLAALPGFVQRLGEREALLDKAVAAIEASGLEPPNVPELEARLGVTGLQQLLRFAAEKGTITAVERDRYFSKSALIQFGSHIRELAVNKSITPQELRDRTGLSRKFLIPLLEWADRAGITRRVGDARVLVEAERAAN
jgi:selenocysteine-specific elongation factor